MDVDEHAFQRVGMVFNGKYTLGRLIGSGGMASVYEGAHRNGHRVAIKVLHPQIASNPELRARFLREGYVANKVDHPSAVRVLDDDVAEDGSVFLVMELLEGETLDARSKRLGGRLPAREVFGLSYQLLDVLAAAHEKGVVHRDIKPENLFLTTDGSLKVLDFGIARLLEVTEQHGATQPGSMIGTPAFMPPEQALGQSWLVDGQTDLWAVAATMFTMLSGQFVHEAETAAEMMVRAGSAHARSVRVVMPALPAPLADVIDGALAFSKRDRWSDARVMEARLKEAFTFSYGIPLARQRESSRPSFLGAEAIGSTVDAGSIVFRAPLPRRPSNPNVSTTNGVAHEKPRPPLGLRAGTWALALGVVALGAGIVGVTRQDSGKAPTVSAAMITGSSVVARDVAAPGPPPLAAAVSIAAAPSEVPELSTPSRSPSPMPSSTKARAASSAPLPIPKPGTAASTPASPRPMCTPNFTLDSEGNKLFKPECFPGAQP